jgi:hypothetical protein
VKQIIELTENRKSLNLYAEEMKKIDK